MSIVGDALTHDHHGLLAPVNEYESIMLFPYIQHNEYTGQSIELVSNINLWKQ